MTVKPALIALATLALSFGSAVLAPAVLAQETKLKITVVAVKASPAAAGVEPGIGPGLETVAAKLQRLPFVRFESDATVTRELAAGESLTVPFASSGRFVISARAAEGGTELEIQEFAPGSESPCLTSRTKVDAGRTQVSFCDGVPEKASTFVFLSSVQR